MAPGGCRGSRGVAGFLGAVSGAGWSGAAPGLAIPPPPGRSGSRRARPGARCPSPRRPIAQRCSAWACRAAPAGDDDGRSAREELSHRIRDLQSVAWLQAQVRRGRGLLHQRASIPLTIRPRRALLRLARPGRRACRSSTLACGHGRITRELARRGADVVGIDISGDPDHQGPGGRAGVSSSGIRYLHDDVTRPGAPGRLPRQLRPWRPVNFGLSDIDDLDAAIAAIGAALKPARAPSPSRSCIPCFAGGADISGSWPASGSYYDEGHWTAQGVRSASAPARSGASHRMLSTYLGHAAPPRPVAGRARRAAPAARLGHRPMLPTVSRSSSLSRRMEASLGPVSRPRAATTPA